MKVLLITSAEEDYLQDSIIHGFKELYGKNAVDAPIKLMLYDDFKNLNSIRGKGFTLYGLLDSSLKSDNEIVNIEQDLKSELYDLIIFTSIYRQYQLFYKLLPLLKKQKHKVCVLDGEDSDISFPYLGMHLKNLFFAPKPHHIFLYFKRELSPNTIRGYLYRLITKKQAGTRSLHKNIKPISFSIPKEKIVDHIPVKTKLFAQHIVDEEIAKKLSNGKTAYSFSTEEEYYKDIQSSKFAITTKRAGWDCLRHYEIAANATVLCFKDLDKKPVNCAPHGLIDMVNCISYKNYDDLMQKIEQMDNQGYQNILSNTVDWIKENTTIAIARKLLGANHSLF